MQNKKIEDIIRLAHSIDVRINLFEGFSPKKTETYKGQLLFWRYIVNIYGLFSDCDRVQLKDKPGLLELMKRYSLITNDEFSQVSQFWNDVSELRKWFCHNNDEVTYYALIRQNKLENYLQKVFLLTTDKAKHLDQVKDKDWNILIFDIERRFRDYLQILEKGLECWKISEYKNELMNEWMLLFSRALFCDKELIQNVVANIAQYEIQNNGLNVRTSKLAKSLFEQLQVNGYSAENIKNILQNDNCKIRSNIEIIYESLRPIKFNY